MAAWFVNVLFASAQMDVPIPVNHPFTVESATYDAD
jgi:hypothetical protein